MILVPRASCFNTVVSPAGAGLRGEQASGSRLTSVSNSRRDAFLLDATPPHGRHACPEAVQAGHTPWFRVHTGSEFTPVPSSRHRHRFQYVGMRVVGVTARQTWRCVVVGRGRRGFLSLRHPTTRWTGHPCFCPCCWGVRETEDARRPLRWAGCAGVECLHQTHRVETTRGSSWWRPRRCRRPWRRTCPSRTIR
jgi:hypothetical protein